MTDPNSSRTARGNKPAKPYKGFPLSAQSNGQWAKRIRGRLCYFGVWADPEAALARYLDERDDWQAGRDPRKTRGGLSLLALCNDVMADREQKLREGAIGEEHYRNLHIDCKRLLEILGEKTSVQCLTPDDFAKLRAALAKGVSPKTLEGRIARIRAVFQYGIKNELLDSVRWGNKFEKPGRRQLQRDRNLKREQHGEYAFSAEQLQRIIEAANPQVKAMTLLGVQAGFQNVDCVELTVNAIHFEDRQIRMVRRKSGAWRVIPLWAETEAALRAAIEWRPQPKDDANADFVFITKYRNKWHRNDVAKRFKDVLDELGIYRPGLSFSALRKTFRTVADGAGDQPATFALMGHQMGDISDKYRESINDERLRAVADHVHQWLYGDDGNERGDRNEGERPSLRIVG